MKIHSVKYNFVMNTITTVLNFVFPLITFPYVSRVLSPSGYGSAEFALATANLFALVALLGVNTYGARECAKVRDDKEALAKAFQELTLIVGIWTIVVTAAFYLFALSVPRFSSSGSVMLVAGLLIPVTTLGVQWFMSANEQYAFMAIRNAIVKVVVVAAMFLFVHTETDVIVWVIISVLSSGIAGVFNFIFSLRNVKLCSFTALNWRKHIKPLLVFFFMVASVSIYTSLDAVMLGYMGTDADVGFYNVAVKIKGVFTAIIGALSAVIVPRATYYLAVGKKDEYQKIVNLSVRAALIYSAFAVPAGILFSDTIIFLLAGEAYSESIPALIAIMPAVMFISFTQITSAEILTPQNRENALAITYGVAGIIDLVLNLILIPQYYALGAAISTTIAEFFVFVSQIILVARRESLRQYCLGCLRLLPILIALVAGLLLGRALFGGGLLSAILTVGVAAVLLIAGLCAIKEPLATDTVSRIIRSRNRNKSV